jgi:hypothetical protein
MVAALASVAGQAPTTAQSGAAFKTSWGDPDLQGIWTDDYQTPLERPDKFKDQEFFTDAQREELDNARARLARREYRDKDAQGKGTEQDVAGAYNSVYTPILYQGKRTSLVVDPPNGKIPPLTPEAVKRAAEDRDYRNALLQYTEGCRLKLQQCPGTAKYVPQPSPRLAEPPPLINTARMNRHDNPEDESTGGRCMGGNLPDLGAWHTIVQSPEAVAIYYDTGQGQGWHRVIPISSAPHLPSNVTTWWGDSRGRWEGNTLVVDVTNFNNRRTFRGSREGLHLVERFARTGPKTFEYTLTIEDPTVWTRPWTVKTEYTKYPDEANRVYKEPRCMEGNYGIIGAMVGARIAEKAFAEGRGPHPATMDQALGGAGGGEENRDPLGGGGC